jgi:hypothetical protein
MLSAHSASYRQVRVSMRVATRDEYDPTST